MASFGLQGDSLLAETHSPMEANGVPTVVRRGLLNVREGGIGREFPRALPETFVSKWQSGETSSGI